MTIPEHSPEEARERAALYALSALDGDEVPDFEAHLTSGCPLCSEEVRSFSSVATDIGRSALPQTPRSALRTRVLERVAAESRTAHQPVLTLEGGLLFARTAQIPWQPGRTAAIESKILFRDADRSYSTCLVRMEPGATYPAHRHTDTEELYLLDGDLLVSGILMHRGDYCRAEPGSVHSDISTHGGCLFISMASERDELLA